MEFYFYLISSTIRRNREGRSRFPKSQVSYLLDNKGEIAQRNLDKSDRFDLG